MAADYRQSLGNSAASVKFESLLPNPGGPRAGIGGWMVLGPFVTQTGGAFETEYFYEREKILDIDYLASSGGEAAQAPFTGQTVRNDYYGPDFFKWRAVPCNDNGSVRFRYDDVNYSQALFATEQRNCVNYAVVYIDCEEESRAVVNYVSSGSYVFLNGERIDASPYGRVKGLDTMGRSVAVTLKKGRNLLMFKVRVGYIADGLDICVFCSILPVAASKGSLGITYPFATGAYFGTKDEPRQIFPVLAGAFGDSKAGSLQYSAAGFEESITIPAIQNGNCEVLRLSVPVKEAGQEKIAYSLGGMTGQFEVKTTPHHGTEGTEHIFSDFHFDTTYHQEQRTYAMGALHITAQMMERLREDPNFKAILSEVDYLHPFYSMYPEYREALREMFQAGRAEADCFYNQPNDLTSSGEGFTRNLIYGQLYHRDVLGRITPVFAPGDVFGHPNQMSQICRKGGCTSAHWGKHVLGVDALFHHVSPDGVGFMQTKGVGCDSAKRLGLTHFSDHGWSENYMETYTRSGDTEWMKDTVNKAQFSVFSEMMDGVIADDEKALAENGLENIEYCASDLTCHHAGVLLTRTDFKQANRLAENLLVTAEKFSAVAAMYGAAYPEKALDKAWRQILCAQHHDSVTGTNNEISFVDLMIEYREAVELAADIVDRVIAFLASGVKLEQRPGTPIFVFNPLTHDRKDVCEALLPSGEKTVFTATVPALGYTVCYPEKNEIVTDGDCAIENEFFKITVDKEQGGGITSIYDKKNRREVVNLGKDGPANMVTVLREVPDRAEEQHEIYTTGHKLISGDYPAEVTCEKTAAYQRLIIKAQLDIVAGLRQEVTLYKGIDRIDMKTVIEDYQSRDDLFTLTFPVNAEGAKPIYEDRYAPHICGSGRKKMRFQTHQWAMFSHSTLAPAVNWMELGPTVKLAFVKAARGGSDITVLGDVNIGMSALIRPNTPAMVKSGNALLKALAKKAIPVTPYNDVYTPGHHAKFVHFNEDLRTSDTRFVLSVDGIANEYEDKLLGELKPNLKAKFEAGLARRGVALLFVRDSDNAWSKPMDVLLIKAASQERLDRYLAELEELLAVGSVMILEHAVLADAPGFVDDYGVSIFNKGTICCSVEPGNLMNMMLFHTANFYGNEGNVTGRGQMIPEQKTHCFTYALYPHRGDFRQARVFTKAYEFNNELIAAAGVKQAANAFLPEKKGFIKCPEDFVVTTIKAGGYPMAQMKANHGSIFERGLTIRGFEAHGMDTQARLRFDFDIGKVQSTDLLDENAQPVRSAARAFTAKIPAHSIETFQVEIPDTLPKIGDAQLGLEAEPVQPVYLRPWEHDLGTMPMGYMEFVGAIGRRVERLSGTAYKFTVFFANNHPDASVAGTAKLFLPTGFTADMTSFDYDVAPRGLQTFEVTVAKPAPEAQGILRLFTTDGGQDFEDIYEFGCFKPDITLRIGGDSIVAEVANRTTERLNGELSLATPFETWEYGLHNRSAMGSIGPRTLKVDVGAGETAKYVFEADMPAGVAFWAAAKLMVNGRIIFGYAECKGPDHNFCSGDIRRMFGADGSIKKFLEL